MGGCARAIGGRAVLALPLLRFVRNWVTQVRPGLALRFGAGHRWDTARAVTGGARLVHVL